MNNQSAMVKYYVGFLVIGLVTLGLTFFVVGQANATKQDKKTYEQAQQAASKLNNYVNREQVVPKDLKEAGITDVPSSISYEKVSEEEYEFCVTYKTARSYSSGDISGLLWGSYMNRAGLDFNELGDNNRSASLYLPYSYKKGKNCYNIEPIITEAPSSTFDNNSSLCDPSGEYYQFYKDYCSSDSNEVEPSLN